MPARREIVVICGPMFSQKTFELIKRTKYAIHADHKVLFINPNINTRDEEVKSRDGLSAKCIKIPSNEPGEIVKLSDKVDVVVIDEAQFFSEDIVQVVEELYALGKRVLVACLDTNFLGKPFGPVPKLLALPEAEIIRHRAVCEHCKRENATRTDLKDKNLRQSFKRDGATILPGDSESYQALCYDCFRQANPEDFESVKTEQRGNRTLIEAEKIHN